MPFEVTDNVTGKVITFENKPTPQDIDEAFKNVDLIATPTTPTTAFKIGEKMDDPVAMYLSDIFSAPANLSGCPSIAIPSGISSDGLPLSFQFVAPRLCEDFLFDIGKKFETM